MRVLITRPREDAGPLAERLAGMGVDSLIEPLLEIRYLPAAGLDLDGVQALLVTSANGARALARATDRRDLPVYAVGDGSARAAGAAGFARVESAAGDVEALAALVVARLDPGAGRVVHVAGSAVAGDLAGRLAAAGFAAERAVLYEARQARALSAACVAALRAGGLDAVALFSPRTAAGFVRLAREAGVAEACAGLEALCLSEAVAERAATLAWRRVRVARRPDLDSFLDLLRTTD